LTELVEEAARTRSTRVELPVASVSGRMPSGIHDADLATFLVRFGTDDHRARLLAPFAEEALRMQRAGVRELYVGGSVLDAARAPGDLDALVHVTDLDALGVRGRIRSWARGTHWHVAERRHATTDPIWDAQRPTWLEFFGRDRAGGEQAIVRVLLG
jgi:hypothetical protein